jgi:hypothetical protein
MQKAGDGIFVSLYKKDLNVKTMRTIILTLVTVFFTAGAWAQSNNIQFDEVNNTGDLQQLTHSYTQSYHTDLFLYPNPAVNSARILLPYVAENRVTVIVMDFNSNILQSWIYSPGGNQLDIDLTAVPAGLYSLRVQEYGYPPDFLKLIKQ